MSCTPRKPSRAPRPLKLVTKIRPPSESSTVMARSRLPDERGAGPIGHQSVEGLRGNRSGQVAGGECGTRTLIPYASGEAWPNGLPAMNA